MQFLLFLIVLPLAGVSLMLALFGLLLAVTLLVEFPVIVLLLASVSVIPALVRFARTLPRPLCAVAPKKWTGAPCV